MDGNLLEMPRGVAAGYRNATCGTFEDEKSAQAWLVAFLRTCKYPDGRAFFKHVREFLPGVPLFRHHRQSLEKESYKCDVLAIPGNAEATQHFGAMVFEVKRSGEKIGPAISQLKDYLSSVFSFDGIQIVPSFGFVFPCMKQHQATASWMQHQSMGSVYQDEQNAVWFHCGEETLLHFNCRGVLDRSNAPRSGRGSGCR